MPKRFMQEADSGSDDSGNDETSLMMVRIDEDEELIFGAANDGLEDANIELDEVPVEESVNRDFVGWGFTPSPHKYPMPADIVGRLVRAGKKVPRFLLPPDHAQHIPPHIVAYSLLRKGNSAYRKVDLDDGYRVCSACKNVALQSETHQDVPPQNANPGPVVNSRRGNGGASGGAGAGAGAGAGSDAAAGVRPRHVRQNEQAVRQQQLEQQQGQQQEQPGLQADSVAVNMSGAAAAVGEPGYVVPPRVLSEALARDRQRTFSDEFFFPAMQALTPEEILKSKDYREDYRSWRKGKAAGAQGEITEVIAEQD